jgi:hypothetical protein
MQNQLYQLLSEFYISLWGEIDSVSDEHRWVRISGQRDGNTVTDAILKQLHAVLNHQQSPISFDQLDRDRGQVTELITQWQSSTPDQRVSLRKSLEETRAYVQEKGLAFGSLAS